MFSMLCRIVLLTVLIVAPCLSTLQATTLDWKLTKNIYIVFDASGSMWQKKCTDGDYKINVAKNALITFLSSVPNNYNLGLYVFDDKGSREMYQLGSPNRKKFISRIKSIFAGGKTPLCNALDQARAAVIKQKNIQLGYGEYTILIVTDGEADNIQELPSHVQQITDEGIVVEVIGFCLSSTHSLKNMVHKYREANSPSELVSALEAVLGEAEQYTDISEFEQIIND